MLDNIPAGIFVVRLEEENDINSFRIVYSNDGTTRSTGISMKPFIGQMLKDVFPAVYEAGLPLKYMEALLTGKPIEIGELEYGDEKITKRTFLLSAIPFGKNHVIVHNENITDLKAAQVENTDLMSEIKKRQTIEEDLKQSNSEIKQFAYIASHDLQEPLQTIMSFITLLQEDYQGKFDPVADKYFEYINKSALRMRALITALLDYSRLGKDADCLLYTSDAADE